MRPAGIAALCLFCVLVVGVVPVKAATVAMDAPSLVRVTDPSAVDAAAVGEVNVLSVAADGSDLVIRDGVSPLRPVGACRSIDVFAVRCPMPTMEVDVRIGLRDDEVRLDSGLPRLRYRIWGSVFDDQGQVVPDGDDMVWGSPYDDAISLGQGADRADSGAGKDGIVSDGPFAELWGGAGDDHVLTQRPKGPVTVHGEQGDDFLIGVGKADGGEGDDRLRSLAGSDTLDGGPGNDLVSYTLRGERMSVDLRRSAPQGAADENDNFVSIEGVEGGAAADQLIGTDERNVLAGGVGADRLQGLGGDDALDGKGDSTAGILAYMPDGPDVLDGGAGRDSVSYAQRKDGVVIDLRRAENQGTPGERDTFASIESADTGAGDDVLIGNGKVNKLRAGEGADRIDAADGVEDYVYCSVDEDTLRRDPLDIIQAPAECETVDTIEPSGGSQGEPGDRDGDDYADDRDPCPDTAGLEGCPKGTRPGPDTPAGGEPADGSATDTTPAPRPSPLPTFPSAPAAGNTQPLATVDRSAPRARLRVVRARRHSLTLRIGPATEALTARLDARDRRGRRLGVRLVGLGAGTEAKVRLRMRRPLPLRRPVRVAVRLRLRDAAGNVRASTLNFRVRATR